MSSYTVVPYRAKELPICYLALVYSKWLRSLRFGNDYFKLIDADSYYKIYQSYIAELMQRPHAVVRLALLTEDKDVCLGFAVFRRNILDYVHVHRDQRRLGIGAKLVPAEIDTISHVTRTGMSIWGSKYGHWKFNPFA